MIYLVRSQALKKLNTKMLQKTKIIALFLVSALCISCFMFQVSSFMPSVQAETIRVENPLEYDNVNSLAEQIRSYLLYIVGGIAIVFIAVSGILYIVGGATMNEGLINLSKKALIGSIAGLVIILAANMILQEIYFIVLGEELDFDNLSASEILMNLINFLLAIVGTLFLISMIVGGIWYFMGGADETKVELGKKTLQYSLIGITIALAAMVLLRQIDRIITGGVG
jgi:hypothetical protein